MLLFSILTLSITSATALGLISGRNHFKHRLLVRQTTEPCTSQCAIVLSIAVNCSTSPDPSCGCSQFVPAAGPCRTCLTETNSTVGGGALNALSVAEGVVICNCQGQSCGDLILGARKCATTEPTNPNCNCPAVVRNTDCYTCLEANDTTIADTLRGDVSRCQAYLAKASPSASSSASASGSPSPSKSAPAPSAASSDAEMMSVQNSVWFSLSVVAVALVYGMVWISV